MPTYVYECAKCNHTEEHFYHNPAQAPHFRDCPACSSVTEHDTRPGCDQPDGRWRTHAVGIMHRQIGPGGGLIFRGPGFHSTDYRKGDPPKEGP